MAVEFTKVIPMLRIFNVEKARDFYLHFLGFKLDWQNDGDGRAPMYMQVSRGDLVLHLTEHYGDCTPGSSVFVVMQGVEEFYKDVSSRRYKYMRPGLRKAPWDAMLMEVTDPFGNRIRFNEYTKNPTTSPEIKAGQGDAV
jgi:catechol 2,3-dioxygenase-like lactoylglutathione lyase family enzyme